MKPTDDKNLLEALEDRLAAIETRLAGNGVMGKLRHIELEVQAIQRHLRHDAFRRVGTPGLGAYRMLDKHEREMRRREAVDIFAFLAERNLPLSDIE